LVKWTLTDFTKIFTFYYVKITYFYFFFIWKYCGFYDNGAVFQQAKILE